MWDLQILLFSLQDSLVQRRRRSMECQLGKDNERSLLQFYRYIGTTTECQTSIFNLLGNITHRGSNSEVHLHTPQQKVPFSLIRCSSSNAKGAYCSCVAWGLRIYNIVESESDPLTRRPVDLFEKEPLKGNSEVHLHTPTKFGEDPSKDLGGDREHTHKRCSNYSMMIWPLLGGCSL